MTDIPKALARAAASLTHPPILWLMLWPVLIALALWTILAFMFWSDLWSWISGRLAATIAAEPWVTLAVVLKWVLLTVLFVPLTLITATLIIGVAAMPVMVRHVGDRDYPQLEKRRGGTLAGSVWNSVIAIVLLVVAAMISLPLWLFPPLWPVLAVALFGWFNERVFRYDALADHADAAELKAVIGENRFSLLGLGLLISLVGFVPLAGFFVPVFGGLVFIHFCLGKLAGRRLQEA